MSSVGAVLVQYCPSMESKYWLEADLGFYAECWRGTGLVPRRKSRTYAGSYERHGTAPVVNEEQCQYWLVLPQYGVHVYYFFNSTPWVGITYCELEWIISLSDNFLDSKVSSYFWNWKKSKFLVSEHTLILLLKTPAQTFSRGIILSEVPPQYWQTTPSRVTFWNNASTGPFGIRYYACTAPVPEILRRYWRSTEPIVNFYLGSFFCFSRVRKRHKNS